ncbi:bifunctional 3-deoxy-7-phosphoheptulonate synthase/chorismate mutase type II [Aureibacter tunicatorum]|uniref:chorismate mutase n=1 Tax=Aureibacter tunicatorum TaxID=866807 RepID=A0AAE3XQJ1_9BACT|nr:bifunctional 3-deoxy-7-phosphoheptulonate synthase/chorismate mutase type II [Aureibacter tunicatorum]MDR6239554.1 chorismate mutase [Aureibacter tunicatorum]BDD04031.1 cytochrome c4 [Aureibacter tunicatorum]
MQIDQLNTWRKDSKKPFVMAGPCSAESEEQLFETSKALYESGISVLRAGVWKPRTRPNTFEGIGVDALKWIQNIKQELGPDVQFGVEVATPQHVEESLKHGIDILWVGARTSVNPFAVQDIADSLKGVDVPVLIKNPINPDLALWIGAIERIYQAGIKKVGAIHRGFSSHKKSKFRNIPSWQIPLELKREIPEMPLICDPSHIAGNSDFIYDISQKAMDLNYDGLIIESHRDPKNAWSDAKQQVTPAHLTEILSQLKVRDPKSDNKDFNSHLTELREKIDQVDHDIFNILSERMHLVEEIGQYKKENNVTVFQVNRWNEILKTRAEWAHELGLNEEFMADLFTLIHDASIRRQTQIMNQEEVVENA